MAADTADVQAGKEAGVNRGLKRYRSTVCPELLSPLGEVIT